MTHSQIKWDMRLQNVKKIQINIFWALLYHVDRETSFQDTTLTPKFFLEFNDFFFMSKKAYFRSKSDICSKIDVQMNLTGKENKKKLSRYL